MAAGLQFTRSAEPWGDLPPSRTVRIPDRGDFFLRDSGGLGIPVLLLHGWLASADTNWLGVYDSLIDAGYRVLAIDHRGHGRGLRTSEPFRIADCAEDVAAVIEAVGCGPVIVVGYSMGGAIAQLLALRHPEVLRGMVLSSTAREFGDVRVQLLLPAAPLLGMAIGLFPTMAWRAGLWGIGLGDGPAGAWIGAELSRSNPADVVEAARELGRYDSRPWIGSVDVAAAVVVTTNDFMVPPSQQFALATSLGAPAYQIDGDHFTVMTRPGAYSEVLLRALEDLLESCTNSTAAAA
jgi:3-oxoadipate enol-lactonase